MGHKNEINGRATADEKHSIVEYPAHGMRKYQVHPKLHYKNSGTQQKKNDESESFHLHTHTHMDFAKFSECWNSHERIKKELYFKLKKQEHFKCDRKRQAVEMMNTNFMCVPAHSFNLFIRNDISLLSVKRSYPLWISCCANKKIETESQRGREWETFGQREIDWVEPWNGHSLLSFFLRLSEL